MKQSKQLIENKIDKYLTKKHLAEALSISIGFVNKLMSEEGLPYVKLGKSVRFRTGEVMAFLKNRRRP